MSTSSRDPGSGSSFLRPPSYSNPEQRSPRSPTLTLFLEFFSNSLYDTKMAICFLLAFGLASIFMCFYSTEQRRRDYRGDIHGRTPQYLPCFPVFKIYNVLGYTNVSIQMPPSCPVHLGNPAGAPPSPQASQPHNAGVDSSSGLPQASQPPNTGVDSSSGLPASQQPCSTPPPVSVSCSPMSQPLNSGVDSSSSLPALQQRLPTPPLVSVPHPPTSPLVLSAVDSSSGLPVSEQPLPTPRPVFESRPSTCQPILNNGVNSSAGFPASQQPSSSPPPKTFTIEELNVATEWFSDTNLLGHGSFGHVYRGILQGGETIAVKRFNDGGAPIERSFQTELDIMSRVNHDNIVSLQGYCKADGQRLLVYEFVPNNTLKHHLHAEGQSCMEWPIRLKIARGVARGLLYLHEKCYPKIIHRDIKPANILLDSNFKPKIADFGSAKLASEGSYGRAPPEGATPGYWDPESFATGLVTDKTDVYSFGVMLLELITGRQAIYPTQDGSDINLVASTRPKLLQAMSDGNLGELVDPRLQNYPVDEMLTLIGCACDCVENPATKRCSMERAYVLCRGENSN